MDLQKAVMGKACKGWVSASGVRMALDVGFCINIRPITT